MSKHVKTILAVSVLFNVLLISVAGGVAVKNYMDHPWHKHKKELSPETRNIVGRVLQSSFRDIRPLGDKARQQRAELIKIISAEEFDGDKFDKTIEKLSALQEDILDKKIAATKEICNQLPQEAREKMAGRMTDVIGGGREHKVKRHRSPKRMKPPEPEHKPESIGQE